MRLCKSSRHVSDIYLLDAVVAAAAAAVVVVLVVASGGVSYSLLVAASLLVLWQWQCCCRCCWGCFRWSRWWAVAFGSHVDDAVGVTLVAWLFIPRNIRPVVPAHVQAAIAALDGRLKLRRDAKQDHDYYSKKVRAYKAVA